MMIFDSASVRYVESFGAGIIDDAPFAVAPKWKNIPADRVKTLTTAQRGFLSDWSRARESCPIEAAEMAEGGAVEEAYEPIEEPTPEPIVERHPMEYIAIDPLDRAWFSGYSVGRANIAADPPKGLETDEEVRSWRSGYHLGYLDAAGAKAEEMSLASA